MIGETIKTIAGGYEVLNNNKNKIVPLKECKKSNEKNILFKLFLFSLYNNIFLIKKKVSYFSSFKKVVFKKKTILSKRK